MKKLIPAPSGRLAPSGLILAIILLAAWALLAITGYSPTQAASPSEGQAQIAENAPGGSTAGSPLQAQAPAGSAVRYSLSGPDAGSFTMNPDTGEISLAQGVSPDFEGQPSYRVTVTAAADLTVNVLNVDEPGTVTLSTDSPRAGETITAALDDPDGGIAGLAWSWARVNNDGATAIPEAAGQSYTPTGADIGHRLRATASYDDNAAAGRQASAETANPVRNDPPEFPSDSVALAVDENSPSGTSVGEPVTAADPNRDEISYSITGSDGFTVDPATGQIMVAPGEMLDHETQPVHTLTITATDSYEDSDSMAVTVNVANVEEPGTLTLSHGELRSGATITAALSDPDGNVSGAAWRWSRSGDQIASAGSSSYTAQAEDVGHVLTARVSYSDGHAPGKYAEASTASAVGNDAPAFPPDALTRHIDENQPPGTAAGEPVTAADPNEDTLAYSLTGSSAFSMDPGTGQITANSGMDHEAQDSYTLTVTATDPHGATAHATVTITVGNLDEPGTVTLDNTSPKAGDAITATLADPDGETSAEAWQWQRSGTDIQGAHSNSYTAIAADLGHTLSLMVNYNDPQGPGKSATSAETAAVSNDPPTFTTADPVNASVRENATPGSPAGNPLEASDPNEDTLSYSLSGDGAGDFVVDADGRITTTAALDHEARSSYTLTATVSDPAGGTDSITVNVTVENVEEPGTVSFGTNAQPEVNTPLTASLTDPDGNVTGESWQWQSAENSSGPWTDIADATGASYTPTANDVDSFLQATVSYTDGHGADTDSASATTASAVQPEPNRAPSFDDATTEFSISINVREGIRVAPPFTATDPNDDTLTYSIVSGTANAFTINSATGEVLMGSAEMSVDTTYTATISVTDGLDDERNTDTSADDTLSLSMTMVNPNIVVSPVSNRSFPYGLWVGDDIVVTTNNGASEDWALFYDQDTQNELEDRNFEITKPEFAAPHGVWSDGATLYLLVINEGTSPRKGKIYGYSLADGTRQSSKDINLANGNRNPYGLTGNNGRLYVTDSADNKVYAYDLATRNRASDHDINGIDRMNKQMTDLWLNGETVWISYWLSDFIRAYDLATGARKPGLDIQTAAENRGPTGIHSDGFHFWALDQVNDTIYGYVLPQ